MDEIVTPVPKESALTDKAESILFEVTKDKGLSPIFPLEVTVIGSSCAPEGTSTTRSVEVAELTVALTPPK